MESSEQRQFENALDFSNSLVNEKKINFQNFLDLLVNFKEIFDREEKNKPYHINLIDELHASENAHSRILEKLLQYQEPNNKRFEILEYFILFIIEKYKYKNEFQKIKIQNPQITQEKKRIDLWIRDKDYSIVIENKVAWAGDQQKQLERYIDITKEQKFSEEQIYVLYLPPTYEKEPEEQSWGKYFEGDIHENRYLILSFRDDILPCIKNNILPNIKLEDKYLISAIEQYIDHLEGKFKLRTIDKKMNMELQKFIKEKLGLNGVEPEIAIEIVSEKLQEMEDATNQLKSIQEEIQEKIDEKYFSKCYVELKELNFNVVRKIDSYPNYCPMSVGIKMFNKLTIWLGKDKNGLFCQLNFNDNNKKLPQKARQQFEEVFKDENIGEDKKNGFRIWAYLENSDNALNYLKEFCAELNENPK